MNNQKVAIVIPFQQWDEWLKQCLEHCARQQYRNFECWLIADVQAPDNWQDFLQKLSFPNGVTIRVSGAVNPARKRNIAMRESTAEIFAFVDADAYPEENWLATAVNFLQGDVCAVGGPNLTPLDDPLLRRVPGCIMQSVFGYGPAYIRHRPVTRRFVNELPTCNLVAQKKSGLFFRETLDTSEDMTFCADILRFGGKILYDPQVIVYHHRRCLFRPFFWQFYSYGRDKARITVRGSGAGYFWHAAPALFTLYLVLIGPLLTILRGTPWLVLTVSLPLLLYVLVVTVESIRVTRCLPEFFLSLVIFPAAHLSYGSGYWMGLIRSGTA